MDVPIGHYTKKQFSDGELYVCIDQDVADKHVWVITATNPPAEHFLELFFLLDALQRAGAHINLLFTYFGYARQDRAESHESLSVQVICNILNLFSIQQNLVVHIHSQAIHQFLKFTDCVPYPFFEHAAQQADIIVAPDEGAAQVAQTIAQNVGKEAGYLEKKRISDVKSKVLELHAHVKGKKVLLIDDMITTGGTIVNAANAVMEHGAQSVSVAATHGIFSGDAYTKIAQSPISNVMVTNSLSQSNSEAIQVYDIGPWLTALITS